jgi:hypothetical protein
VKTSPLPLSSLLHRSYQISLAGEGSKKREGGFAPSQILFPLSNEEYSSINNETV